MTDGQSQTLKIGGTTVRFRHSSPRVVRWVDRPAVPVALALRWPGPLAAADGGILSTLNRNLSDNVKSELLRNSRDLPGWAVPLVRSIAGDQALEV